MRPGVRLGIDVGKVRIGVASSDPHGMLATPVGTTDIDLDLGTDVNVIGFDFNPTVDRIRVVSSNDRNYRLNPNTGAIAFIDTNLAYAATDPNIAR